MRYLLDTQIFIWTLISPEKLTTQTQNILKNSENMPIISADGNFHYYKEVIQLIEN